MKEWSAPSHGSNGLATSGKGEGGDPPCGLDSERLMELLACQYLAVLYLGDSAIPKHRTVPKES